MAKSWIVGGRPGGESYAAGSTLFFLLGGSIEADLIGTTRVDIPEDLTARNWAVRCGANTLSGNCTVVIRKNNTTDTGLTVTFTPSDADVEKTISGVDETFAQDDDWVGKVVTAAGTGAITLRSYGVEIEPDNANSTLSFFAAKSASSSSVGSAGSAFFAPFGVRVGRTTETFTGAESTGVSWQSIGAFTVVYFAMTSGTITWTGTINTNTRVNSSDGGSALSFTASDDQTIKTDTTGTDALTDGDEFNYEITLGAGSGSTNIESWNCWLRSSNGEFLMAIGTFSGFRVNAGLTRYWHMQGEGVNATTAEAESQLSAPFDMTITQMQVMSDRERNTSTPSPATLRVNGSPTGLSVSFPASGAGNIGIREDTDTIGVSAGDLLATEFTTGNGTNRDWSYVVYLAEAFGGVPPPPTGTPGLSAYPVRVTPGLYVNSPPSIAIDGSLEIGTGQTVYAAIQHPTQTYAYVTINTGLTVINVSDRDTPSLVGTVTAAVGLIGNQAILGLVFDSTGRYLYATSGATSLYTFDLGAAFANVQDPGLVNTDVISQGNGLHVLTRIGSELFVLADTVTNNSFQVVDISTPSNPSVSSTTAMTGNDIEASVGHANPSGDRILYAASDNSGTILVVPIASPGSFTTLQLPTVDGQQIRHAGGIVWSQDGEHIAILCHLVLNTINHYFWMVYDITVDYATASARCSSESIISTAIASRRAPTICSSPRHAISVGGFWEDSQGEPNIAVSIRDDAFGANGQVWFYHFDNSGHVPRYAGGLQLSNRVFCSRSKYWSDFHGMVCGGSGGP